MNIETFNDLNVLPEFTEKLRRLHITAPTTIQKLVIPRLNAGDTVLFHSATGTGKTFAYLLPFLGKIMPRTGAAFLIIAPTLELCSQIKREADFLLADQIQTALIIGSASISRQIESIKKDKPAVIVGNPSRLLQLVKMGKLKLNNIRFLVLDEGDRLVSDEQYEQTAELCSAIKTSRQTASCSATFSAKSRERLMPLLGTEAVVTLETNEQEIIRNHIQHLAFFAEDRRKIKTLCSLLAALRIKKALVFSSSAGQIGNIVAQLQYHGIAAGGISGKLDKKLRKHSFDDFRCGRINVLVSSDLAARGLDIQDISHIIALDVPENPEVYLHRAGRTARAGAHGTMISIGNAPQMYRLAALEKHLGIVVYPRILYRGQIIAPEQP